MSIVSHGAAARQISPSEIEHDFPEPLPMRGRVCEFTRHQKHLARIVKLDLRAGAARVLAALLTFADRDGWCWPKPRELARIVKKSGNRERGDAAGASYSLPTIKRSLRELRAAGFLTWERIAPLGHFPSRPDRNGPAVMGAGEWTSSGGRAWRVDFAAIEAAAGRGYPKPPPKRPRPGPDKGPGTGSAGEITSDPSTEITGDPSSDQSPLGDFVTLDHGRPLPALAGTRAPAGRQAAGETPSRAFGAGAHAPAGHRVASETPGSAIAMRSEQTRQDSSKPPTTEPGGEGEHVSGRRGASPPALSVTRSPAIAEGAAAALAAIDAALGLRRGPGE